ncbi:glycosyltransferase [Chitinophaga ginsengisegetis]|uniref:glycosyltransferase n=1 Tax=Chitinophaga ginsengisegetis TaxID=393003 RepID=UPI000DBACDE6|nr:glycosyltransferase [Chitinophaga ginsengisegetis]MDR6566555.1 glycosyltransferase involved in cell wall biosynthesis [Chitinophaga ginsengisegetis]MDR6646285.1 glycosyltransferase involved in cell wall biosynthesis [Chitinophaga ginsengisegetis]MDR6651122.1 glycosyltransferase involved in cell wall biosynthesis [Chitinophaga ginsengisegetis]
MRIAYLLDWDINAHSGVLNKVEMQVNMWEKAGHEVFVCFTSYRTNYDFIIKARNVKVFERPALSILYFPPIRTFLGKAISYRQILKYLKSVNPDVIYFRQSGMWFPYLDKILGAFPSVMEANTLDLKEIHFFYGALNRAIYKFGRKRIVRAVKGFVTVTNEIGHEFISYNKPIEVIANGMKIAARRKKNTAEKKSTDLIFVGSPGQSWQGEDLVVELAAALPDFNFHIVGTDGKNMEYSSNVKFYGYLNRKELSDLYEKVDIGIGTLALHRKGMKEACPLKVREYLSWGLPVILGYDDTDIKNVPFALNISFEGNNVGLRARQVETFVKEWKGKIVSEAELVPLIGVEPKENKRLAFLKLVSGLFHKN